jgi:D-glycero-alpha-D-manno-heptose-7-phosphate kinase
MKSNPPQKPVKVIHARAPIRANDIGGWTDTWFASEGKVLNLAVSPAVEVQVKVFENIHLEQRRVTVQAENYQETFRMNPDRPRRDPHALLQFTIASLPIPKEWRLEINLRSAVPAGISTGTSASVCVALLGALNQLQAKKYGWADIASLAHRVETEDLKQQSGIQDQICAAHGGISFIHMQRYPESVVQKVRVGDRVWQELDRRLCLVYLGKPHRSSSMHDSVIAELEAGGPQLRYIRQLTGIAQEAKGYLVSGDFEAYGDAMIRNNECQRELHSRLIAREADAVADLARKWGAVGWKVNGAGGKGGSMTVLASGDDVLRRQMIQKIQGLGKGIRMIPVSLSATGLSAWETT